MTRPIVCYGMLIVLLAVSLAPDASANLVVNGDFGTGDFTGWTSTGNVGPYQNTANWNGSDSAPNGVLSQVIPTTPGKAYALEFDYGVLSFTGLSQSLDVEVIDGLGGVLLSYRVTDSTPSAPATFGHYPNPPNTFTAPGSSVTIRFKDVAGNSTTSVDGILDNVSVVALASIDPDLWVTNGSVSAVVRHGGTIYIGGTFTRVGPATGQAVAIDAGTGAAQQPYPRVNGFVYAVAPDGSGGWYVAGSFTTVRGQSRNNLAQLDASGNLTSWNPSSNAVVHALAVSGGTVYAGGYFTSIGGQARNHIAALDGVSGLATSWNPSAAGTSQTGVGALAVSGSTVYAGGSFTSMGGQARNYIAALDAVSGAATSWNPNANNIVLDLAVSGSTVYAGGSFTSIGGQARSSIAALDAASGNATSWNPGANDLVDAVAVSGGTVYAGGYFTSIGGQARNRIAALDAVSGAATSWNPNANAYVSSLVVSGSTVYAGGNFTSIGGQARGRIAALDAASGSATSWDPSAFNTVLALATSGSMVYAGGAFTSVGGVVRSNIAALDAASGAATGWNPIATASVFVLRASGSIIYAGGGFSSIGGQPRNQIAALDAVTGAATSWNPGANLTVHELAVSGSTIYAGGHFTSIGGQPRNRIAALDAVSGAATTWNPNANDVVVTLAVSGGTVYAGGNFTNVGGQPRNRIAALDAAGAATSWNPNANTTVHSVVPSGGKVYAGGAFTSIGGQARGRIAALDVASGNATSWNPTANGSVFALVLNGGAVYAAGAFTSIGGQGRGSIAALEAVSGAATSWNPNASGNVSALAVNGGSVDAGGSFTAIGGQPHSSFASSTHPLIHRDLDGDGHGDPATALPVCDGCVPSPGYVASATDCDDTDAAVHPGALDQTCNGIDDDCDGQIDEGVSGCPCVENGPGLAGWWRGNGSPADDAAGNHGTPMGGAGYAAGKVGQAFSLNGTTAYVADLGDAYSYAFMENTGVFTINAWIKLNDVTSLVQMMITASTGEQSEKGHFFIWHNSGGEQKLRLGLMKSVVGTPVIDASSPDHVITDTGWHHVAAVGNGTTVTFYVDGVARAGSGTMASKPSGPSTRAVHLGRLPPPPGGFFNGMIDELQIHERALSASEIGAIFDAGSDGMCGPGCAQSLSGLVGWWPGSGDGADRSSSNHHGSLAGSVSFVPGKVGQAFSFTGASTGYVGLPNAAALQFPSQFTLAAWIKPSDVSGNRQIISKWSFSAGDYAYQMNIHPVGSLRLDVSGNGTTYATVISPGGVLGLGVWKHVAATFDAGACKLYVDGVAVTTQSTAPITSIHPTTTVGPYLGVGNGDVQRFSGLIDEPMMFDRALSGSEIAAIYQAGSSGMCGLGLVNDVEEPGPGVGPFEFVAPWPNPATRAVHVRFRLPAAAAVRAEVFDVMGRRVASLIDGRQLAAGEHRAAWDGRSDAGQRVAAGIYQIRVAAGGALAVRKVVMVE